MNIRNCSRPSEYSGTRSAEIPQCSAEDGPRDVMGMKLFMTRNSGRKRANENTDIILNIYERRSGGILSFRNTNQEGVTSRRTLQDAL
jgi:hypothetical protein